MIDSDTDYYRRRAQRERDLAARAVSPQIARLHLQLADAYAARAEQHPRPKLTLAFAASR